MAVVTSQVDAFNLNRDAAALTTAIASKLLTQLGSTAPRYNSSCRDQFSKVRI